MPCTAKHAVLVKFHANHWLSVGSVEMRASTEDSRVSDLWDSRKMMSSKKTETVVFGPLPEKQCSHPQSKTYSYAFTIFASSSLI